MLSAVNPQLLSYKLLARKMRTEGMMQANSLAPNEDSVLPPSSGGQAVPAAMRSRFRAVTGQDPARAQIFTGPAAEKFADRHLSKAVTVGQNIYFGKDQYCPDTEYGQELLAHELTHTFQQCGGEISMQAKLTVSEVGDSCEQEADAVAAQVMRHSEHAAQRPVPMPISTRPSTGVIQRRVWVNAKKKEQGLGGGDLILPESGLEEETLKLLAEASKEKPKAEKSKKEGVAKTSSAQTSASASEKTVSSPQAEPAAAKATDKASADSAPAAASAKGNDEKSAAPSETAGITGIPYAEAEQKIENSITSINGIDPVDAAGRLPEMKQKLGYWASNLAPVENKKLTDSGDRHPDSRDYLANNTQERRYSSFDELAIALYHESNPQLAIRLHVEGLLAKQVRDDPRYVAALDSIIRKVYQEIIVKNGHLDTLEDLKDKAGKSRYGNFAQLAHVEEILKNPSASEMAHKVVLLDEIYLLSKYATEGEHFKKYKQENKDKMEEVVGKGSYRNTGYAVNEGFDWVAIARKLEVPLWAGPSGTTLAVMTLAQSVGASRDELYKLAWVMFAFFNGMWTGQSATHRLHEVMAAASAVLGPEALKDINTATITTLPALPTPSK